MCGIGHCWEGRRAVDAEAGVALAEGAQMAVGKADAAVEVTVARLMVAAEGGECGQDHGGGEGGAGRWPGRRWRQRWSS